MSGSSDAALGNLFAELPGEQRLLAYCEKGSIRCLFDKASGESGSGVLSEEGLQKLCASLPEGHPAVERKQVGERLQSFLREGASPPATVLYRELFPRRYFFFCYSAALWPLLCVRMGKISAALLLGEDFLRVPELWFESGIFRAAQKEIEGRRERAEKNRENYEMPRGLLAENDGVAFSADTPEELKTLVAKTLREADAFPEEEKSLPFRPTKTPLPVGSVFVPQEALNGLLESEDFLRLSCLTEDTLKILGKDILLLDPEEEELLPRLFSEDCFSLAPFAQIPRVAGVKNKGVFLSPSPEISLQKLQECFCDAVRLWKSSLSMGGLHPMSRTHLACLQDKKQFN